MPMHNGIFTPKRVQEGLSRVPSTQFVWYIVDEVDSMSIIGHLEEERRTRNYAQDTTCSDTLEIPKDMYPGQAHIATCREPLYVHPCCPLPHSGHVEISTFIKSEQQVHDKGKSIFPGVVGHSSVGGCNMDPPQKLHYFSRTAGAGSGTKGMTSCMKEFQWTMLSVAK